MVTAPLPWSKLYHDSLTGAYDWAKQTLKVHADDKRDHIYSKEQLEFAKTHDDLWNAAQVSQCIILCFTL